MALKNDLYINVEPYTEILGGGLSFVLSISNGVVKLTGKTGTGKTAMCIELLKELKTEKIEFVHFQNAPESYAAVQAAIQEKLKLDSKTEGDKDSFIQSLTAHIIKKSFDEQRLVLIFDDVENLGSDVLTELTSFRHIHLNDQGLVSIVLSGTEEMEKKLSNGASSLIADLLVSYTLEPMNREQLAEFCKVYLAEIKMEANLTEENISQLLEITEGYPGDIPEMIPEILDANDSKLYVKKKKQKEFVTKTTNTLAKEFIDPFTDEETKKQVFGRWKGSLGRTVILAGVAVTLFVGYSAYVFIPVDIIPATVSYFNDDIEPVVDIALEPPVIIDEIVLQTPQTDGSAEELVIIEPELEENLTDDLSPTLEQEVIIEPTPEVITQIQNEPEVTQETVPAFQVTATDEVQQVVEQWLQAWQQQDLNSYFSSYHESFESISFSSLTTWQNNRERNILRPASIDISYDDYMVLSRNADSTMLTLRMTYQSPTYADSTLKQLGLIRDSQGDWKIIFEENIQVERLPVNRDRIAATQTVDQLEVYLVPNVAGSQGVPVVGMSPGQVASNLSNQQEQMFNFINNWLTSWQNQDVNAYFNYYQDNFRTYNFLSTSAWEQDRMTKIVRPSYIELRMSDFEVLQETVNEAVIQFSLEYRSAYYADRTLKEVLLTRDGNGNFQISNELNRQIETLPIYRRINIAVSSIF
ncbi:ATP-binding protein [Gammaproteobacteria bacterium]|nr:ATP-binding protein [Gammaproteobacteria bacterium]